MHRARVVVVHPVRNSRSGSIPNGSARPARPKHDAIASHPSPAARSAQFSEGLRNSLQSSTNWRQRCRAISDPVQIGLVASLNRPGGNLTGVSVLAVEVGPKLMELLHAAVPSAKSMGLLINPRNPNADAQSKNLQAAAQRLGLQLHVLNASTEGDLDPVFARVHEIKANALMIAQDALFNTQTGKLADLSVRYAIPAIYPNRSKPLCSTTTGRTSPLIRRGKPGCASTSRRLWWSGDGTILRSLLPGQTLSSAICRTPKSICSTLAISLWMRRTTRSRVSFSRSWPNTRSDRPHPID
jgi:hypothetical protein